MRRLSSKERKWERERKWKSLFNVNGHNNVNGEQSQGDEFEWFSVRPSLFMYQEFFFFEEKKYTRWRHMMARIFEIERRIKRHDDKFQRWK